MKYIIFLMIILCCSIVFAADEVSTSKYYVQAANFADQVETTIVNPNIDYSAVTDDSKAMIVNATLKILDDSGNIIEACQTSDNKCSCTKQNLILNKAENNYKVREFCGIVDPTKLKEAKYSVEIDIECAGNETPKIYCKDHKEFFVSVIEPEVETVGVDEMPLLFVVLIAGFALIAMNRK